jgi:small subunit ribosomal protein S7
MPRKARSYDKHTPDPDPKYGSVKYAKFINYLMERGKKNTARKIFYDALNIVEEKAESLVQPAVVAKPAVAGKTAADADQKPQKAPKLDGRQVFDIALKNIAPIMELKSRRIGGANYQVPMEVLEPRKTTLAMRWLLIACRAKKGAPMSEKLAAEILEAYNKQGAAIKKRDDVHRMAEANKAFAHFARFGNKRR